MPRSAPPAPSIFLSLVLLAVLAMPAAAQQPPAAPPGPGMAVRKLGDPGPLEIVDGDQPVLRYNYQIVSPPADFDKRISEGNRKYAVARSDYIHPLYGPGGEVLTADWVTDHPHHRGVYWAWPEVDWQGKRGDLHALQMVFARPTGKIRTDQGPDFALIEAENQWRWEDRTPIVREEVTIRAHARTGAGRAIDLSFRFTALDADVLLARRGQTHYGGLNLRLAAAKDQEIVTFTDPPSTLRRRAWADRSGTVAGGQSVVGLTILQNLLNPDYPGDWVQFPEISWVQPTFPASGTRWTLTKDRPLELSYRLWVHEGKAKPEILQARWTEYNARGGDGLDPPFRAVLDYEFGKPRAALAAVERLLRTASPDARARFEPNLIGVLQSPQATADARTFACRELARVGTEACVPVVAPLMVDKELAHAARYVLLAVRGEQADQALRAALEKAEGGAKVGLVNVLAARRDVRAVPLLVPLVHSGDPALAAAVVTALGKIGGPEAARTLAEDAAAPALRAVLLDARLVCAEGLASAGATAEALAIYRRELADAAGPPQVRIAALRGIVLLDKERALPEVIALLTGGDARLRKAAAGCLALIPGTQAVRAYCEALPKAPPDAQVVVLGQLAARGDRSAAEDVARLAGCAVPDVCHAAVTALGDLGQPAQVGLLVQCAREKTGGEGVALASLVRLRAEGVDAEILRQLEATDDAGRAMLVGLLDQRCVKAAVPALVKLAGEADPAVRQAAIKALGNLVDDASLGSLVGLLTASESPWREAAVEATVAACRRLGNKTDLLLRALPGASPSGRAAIVAALGPLGGEASLGAVAAAASDAEPAVRDAALRALTRWPDARAVPELLRLIGGVREPPRRIAALRGCAQLLGRADMAPEEKVRCFGELLKLSERPEEKKLMPSGLGTVKSVEALELAATLVDTEDLGCEAAAAIAAIVLPDAKGLGGMAGARAVEMLEKSKPKASEALRAKIDQYLATLPRPDPLNLAADRPVKTSVAHQGGWRPELAVDGRVDLQSFWSGETTPAWLSVDLGRTVKIGRALVVFYWDGSRYYQYTLDVSADGQTWQTVADQTKNTAAGTPQGTMHSFPPVEARYVRVNILKDSANPGAHIVELKVYAAAEGDKP